MYISYTLSLHNIKACTNDLKVLILDEPTSGVDVEARRLIWQVHPYLVIHIYSYNNHDCLCGSVAKASDTQAVGHGFEPRPDH